MSKKKSRKLFPYIRVARLRREGHTIAQIAKRIGRLEKGKDDPYRGLRNYRDQKGEDRKVALPGTHVYGAGVREAWKGVSVPVKDTVGKIFLVEGWFRRCVLCDELFTVEAGRQHAATPCFPKPDQRCPSRTLEPSL